MRILFATTENYVPDRIEGGVLDIHHIALTLRSQGHEVSVIAPRLREYRYTRRTREDLGYRVRQKLVRSRLLTSQDTINGYVTTRALFWLVPRLLEQHLTFERPDIVIVQGYKCEQLAQVAVDHGVPVIMRLVTVFTADRLSASAETKDDVAELLANPMVKVMSNSHFIAAHAEALLGVTSVVCYPLIRLEDSVASDWTPRYIAFVGPTQLKGLATAVEVAARLPQRQFVFAESYHLSGAERKELDGQLTKLPNVSFRPRSPNLKDLYRETALLLMPSQVQEAFGRVVIEACANGIPVVAARIGGIPEAMGEAGALLGASDPPERWAETIEEILSDPELYSRLSASALANAERDEFNASVVSNGFIEVAKAHAAKMPCISP